MFFKLNFKEEKTGQKSNEGKDVRLNGVFPPIEKMDASLSTLAVCEYEILIKKIYYFITI